MNIAWLQLLPAVFLLWLPRQLLRIGGRVFEFQRHRRRRFPGHRSPALARDPTAPSVRFRPEIVKLRNTIDFLRAGLGTVMLMGGMPGIAPAWQAAPGADPETIRLVTLARCGILLVGVLIQLFRFEHGSVLFAPIFYLTGLSVGLSGWAVGGFAVLLVWLVNPVLPNPAAFLSMHALLVVLLGAWFVGAGNPRSLLNAALVFVPVAISLVAGRPLVQLSKRAKVSAELVR